ncbi:hypothetical protein [Paenibacillus sp. CECT 9249]|nr:hypothetical protein [Paenibacillus sp. CECT 9249]
MRNRYKEIIEKGQLELDQANKERDAALQAEKDALPQDEEG